MTSVDKYTPVWWEAEYAAYQELTRASKGQCFMTTSGLKSVTADILDKMNERRRVEEIEAKKLAEKAAAAAAAEARRAYWLSPAGIEEKRLAAEKMEAAKLKAREKLIELKMVELRKKEEEAEIEAEARRRLAALVPRERLIELKMAELRKKEEEAEIEAEAISRLGLAAIFTP